jgi:DNA-binding PucR family transcriptional regulator
MEDEVIVDLLNGLASEAAFAELDEFVQRRLASGIGAGVVDEERRAASRVIELLSQRRERSMELSALNAIAGRLSATNDVAVLLQEIVDQTRLLLRVDLAYLSLLVGEQTLRIEVTSGAVSAVLRDVEHSLHRGLVAEAMRRGEPASTGDYLIDTEFAHEDSSDLTMTSEGVRALIVAPLKVLDRPIGALFAAVREPRNFGLAASELLTALAAHAAIAIENAKSSERLNGANAALQKRSRELEQVVQWDTSLTEVVLRGGGVDDLVAEIARIVGSTVTFRRSSGPAPEGEPLRVVRAGGKSLGYLEFASPDAAVAQRNFLDRAESALALACLAEESAAEAARRATDATLIGLLTRATSMQDTSYRHQARAAGIDPEKKYSVLVTQAVKPDPRHPWLRTQLRSGSWPRGTVIAEFGERVLTIVPIENTECLADMYPAALRGRATTGIGPVVPARHLVDSHTAAQQTVDVMVSLGRAGMTGTSDDLGLYRVLLNGASRPQIDKIIDSALGPVLREEENRKVPLLETVEAYLGNHQRHAATARELNVHANTLYQRLDLIDSLLGSSWRTRDRAVDLQVALRLRGSLSDPSRQPSG